jgi:hypothetical protein
MKEMIIVLPPEPEVLGAVRCIPQLQAAAYQGAIWLRGIPVTGETDLRIRQLPGIHTYVADDKGRLFPLGKPTPVMALPELDWQPLREFLPVSLPVSGLPGIANINAPVGLAPFNSDEMPNALLTDLTTWKAYAETAPAIRLEQTKFAVSVGDDVLILGDPLPPMPGKALVRRGLLIFPAGWHLDPPFILPLVETTLIPTGDALLLFDIDGSWQRIEQADFVNTTRSAVRATDYQQT